MKRTFALLFVLLLVLSPQIVFAAEEDAQVQLSSLSEEECRQFLLERGITIPEGYENVDFPKLFAAIEGEPYRSSAFGDAVFADFFEEIKIAVNAYYGIPLTYAVDKTRSLTYVLQHSDLVSWDPITMGNYNCYAFVLGITNKKPSPGSFSNGSYGDGSQIVEVAANLVEADLTSDELGYNCVKRLHTLPTTAAGWENVIAFRKDTTNDAGFNDFHFAMLTSSGWLHKPGGTAILKFKEAPSNSVDWTNENYNGAYNEHWVTYDSDIIYFLCKAEHGNLSTVWQGDHYHLGATHCFVYQVICDDCDTQVDTVIERIPCSGPPCLVQIPGGNA